MPRLLLLLLQSSLLLLLVLAISSTASASQGRDQPSSRRQPQTQLDSTEDKLATYIHALVEVIKREEGNKQEQGKSDEEQDMITVMKELVQAVKNNTQTVGKAIRDKASKCDPPFLPLKGECFYVNTRRRLSWIEAQSFCRGLGGDLAEPQNVNGLRGQILHLHPEDQHQFFWVGASEGGVEGDWRWVSGKNVSRNDFFNDQPDGGNENCVVLSRDDFPPLHDSPCYAHTMFICEQTLFGEE